MKNIKHVQLINQTLTYEKDKWLKELAIINDKINRKISNIERIRHYQDEYNDDKKLQISRIVPALHKNLTNFSQRIDEIIRDEEAKLEKLTRDRDMMEEKIELMRQKIKLMEKFAVTIETEQRIQLDKREQSSLDDLASNKFTRGSR